MWRFSIYVMNADGSERRSLTKPNAGRYAFLAWSPDGRKIAFLSDRDTPCDCCFHVYVMNADGSGERNLTRTLGHAIGGYASPPAWSPDGRKIAFVSDSDAEVYVMNADGSGQRRLARWITARQRDRRHDDRNCLAVRTSPSAHLVIRRPE
jgi:Tol biopolymer transport system component